MIREYEIYVTSWDQANWLVDALDAIADVANSPNSVRIMIEPNHETYFDSIPVSDDVMSKLKRCFRVEEVADPEQYELDSDGLPPIMSLEELFRAEGIIK